MITRLRQRHLKNIVSKDALRPAMQGVYYDPEKQTLTGTDGHVLVRYRLSDSDISEYDNAGILPIDAFASIDKPSAAIDITPQKPGITDNGDGTTTKTFNKVESTGSKGTLSVDYIDGQYPNVDQVLESRVKDRDVYSIALDLDLFAAIRDAIPQKSKRVLLHFSESNKAILIDWIGIGDLNGNDLGMPESIRALVMPVMEDDYVRSDAPTEMEETQ